MTRRREAGEIPGRVDEGVHRVGFAPCRLAASGAGDMFPCRMVVERIARLVERDIIGQLDREVLSRHWNSPAIVTMDYRDRRAPVALARQSPVAQAEIGLACRLRRIAECPGFEEVCDRIERLVRCHAIEIAGIDHHAIADIGRRR
jgi:hypothetical protein